VLDLQQNSDQKKETIMETSKLRWTRKVTVTVGDKSQSFVEYNDGTVSISGKNGMYTSEQLDAGIAKATAAGHKVEIINA